MKKQFGQLKKTNLELMEEKKLRLEKEAKEQAHQEYLIAQINPEIVLATYISMQQDDHTIRNFDHVYALIYCNEVYQELNKVMKMADLP